MADRVAVPVDDGDAERATRITSRRLRELAGESRVQGAKIARLTRPPHQAERGEQRDVHLGEGQVDPSGEAGPRLGSAPAAGPRLTGAPTTWPVPVVPVP